MEIPLGSKSQCGAYLQRAVREAALGGRARGRAFDDRQGSEVVAKVKQRRRLINVVCRLSHGARTIAWRLQISLSLGLVRVGNIK